MIRLWCLTLFCSIFVAASHAAEIPVRSGAHDGFARLVLDVPNGTEWELNQSGDRAQVRIAAHSDGFDVTSVFDRIDRSIIASVSSEPGALNIAFGCDCSAEVFRAGQNMIVVDVREAEGSNAPAAPTLAEFGLQFVGRTPLAFEQNPVPLASVAAEPVTVETSEPVDDSQIAAPQVRATNASSETDLESLRQAQEKLAERISFAATTGVLRPNNGGISLPLAEQRPQIDTRIFDSSLPDPSNTNPAGPLGGNLRVTSSNDIPVSGLDQIQNSTTLGVRCIDPSLVRIQDWGGSATFAMSVSTLRRNLYTEFDVLNENAATDLARLYLHYGFGAEARQMLLLNDQLDATSSPLFAMAEVMEYGTAQSGNHLESFVDCDSDAALWAILASRDLLPSDTINSQAALRTLSSLPLHLRRFLAPELSKKLLNYGDETAASAALRGLERTSEPLPSAGELAKADIELAQGDVERAQARLRGVVESNDQQSAEALIRYVDTHLDAEVAIDDDIATLVEAYAIEFRDDPLGAELRRTHVLALAKAEQFDAAFTALDRMRPGGETGLADSLMSPLIELLTKSADDATFLEHSFATMTARSGDLSAQAKIVVAERLADLGFFGEAEQLLAMAADLPSTPRSRLLRARISMGLSRPRQALAFLGSLDDEASDRLRAEATELAGDYEAAHTLFENMDASTDQLRSAWMSDQWQVLIEPNEPVLGPAVDVAATPLDNSTDVSGMLGRTENALEESAKTREVIRQLLSADVLAEPSEG